MYVIGGHIIEINCENYVTWFPAYEILHIQQAIRKFFTLMLWTHI